MLPRERRGVVLAQHVRREQVLDRRLEGEQLLARDEHPRARPAGDLEPLAGQDGLDVAVPVADDVALGHLDRLREQAPGLDRTGRPAREAEAAAHRLPPPLAPAPARRGVADEAVLREVAQVPAGDRRGGPDGGGQARRGARAVALQLAEDAHAHRVGEGPHARRVQLDVAVRVGHRALLLSSDLRGPYREVTLTSTRCRPPPPASGAPSTEAASSAAPGARSAMMTAATASTAAATRKAEPAGVDEGRPRRLQQPGASGSAEPGGQLLDRGERGGGRLGGGLAGS